MEEYTVILPVVLLFVAFIASLIVKGRLCNYITSILVSLASIIMMYLGLKALSTGEILSYTMVFYKVSGLTLGLNGISLVVDQLSAFFLLILGALGLAISIYALKYMDLYIGRGSMRFFGINYASLMLTMYMVIVVFDIFWFIVFWELMTVTSQFLVSFRTERESARRAAYKYFFMVKAGSELIVVFILVVLIYLTRFNTSYTAVKAMLTMLAQVRPDIVAILFIVLFIGLGVKAAIYPLHTWLPGALSEAPSNIAALFTGAMEKMAIYMMVRSFFWFAPSLLTTLSIGVV